MQNEPYTYPNKPTRCIYRTIQAGRSTTKRRHSNANNRRGSLAVSPLNEAGSLGTDFLYHLLIDRHHHAEMGRRVQQ